MLFFLAAPVYAIVPDSRAVFFDIPSQPLTQGIIEFSIQANVTIISQEEYLSNHLVTPIIGYHHIESALSLLVAHAPVSVVYSRSRDAYLLVPKPLELIIVKSEAPATEEAESIIMEELIVTGTNIRTRYPNFMKSLDRNGVSHFDSSRFHNVASKDFISDLEPNSLTEVLQYSSGATASNGLEGTNDDFYIRGYRRKNLYVDGFRLSDRTAMRLIPVLLSKLEVLKGPSMLFYGQSGAGGVVNAISLTPDDKDAASIHGERGSENLVKGGIDLNISSAMNARMPVRLIGMHEKKGGNDVFSEQIRNDVMGVVEAKRSEKLTALINYHFQSYEHSYGENRTPIDSNGFFISSHEKSTPIDNQCSDFKARIGLLSASWHYHPSKTWRLSGNYLWQEERRLGLRTDEELVIHHDALLPRSKDSNRLHVFSIANRIVAPMISSRCGGEDCNVIPKITSLDDQEEYETDVSMNLSLTGNFKYFAVESRTVLGVDFYHQDLYQQFLLTENKDLAGDEWEVGDDFQDFELLELLNSQHLLNDATNPFYKEYRFLRDDFGIYNQINTQWSDKWISSVGWRFSKFIGEQRNLNAQAVGLRNNASDISPQLGVVFQPIDSLSFFTNYSESVAIRYLIDDYYSFSKYPEVAKQWEVGIKRLGFGELLSWSAAFFKIKNQNTFDVMFNGGVRELQGPFNYNVSGLESDLSYDLADNWQITSHASILKSKIVGADSSYISPHVPDITLSLFNHWSFFEAWQATLGAYSITDRSLDVNQASRLNAYVSLNGSLSYAMDLDKYQLGARLIVKNLLNNNFYRAASLGGYADENQGRSISVRFQLNM